MSKVLRNTGIIVFAVICIVYSLVVLTTGFFPEIFTYEPYLKMLLEILCFFLLSMAGIKKSNVLWLIFIGSIFSYLHMMIIPIIVAFLYTVLTFLVGIFVNQYIIKNDKERLISSFFIGVLFLTISYAVLSLFHLGSIGFIRIFDGILLIVLLVLYLKKNRSALFRIPIAKFKLSKQNYALLALTMCFLMLAIGRANISLDYDSLWYGLRSPYVLSHNYGIYENLKLVGCVYTYPKGYEIYELPLASTTSYGYIYAGNIVLMIILLYVIYRICCLFLDNNKAMWSVVLVASIPGITNMSITAKPDIMTLLVQLISIYLFILFLKKRNGIYFGGFIASYIFTQTLKPTAVVFSTSILLLAVFICIVYQIKPVFGKKAWFLTIISLIDLVLIWLRTFLLTGMPATSVWGKLFRALGMKDKYPYASGQISQFRSENIFSKKVIEFTINRIKEFFLAPNSTDTDHVIVAWGTTLCLFMIMAISAAVIFNFKMIWKCMRKNPVITFMGLLFWGEFFGCILSLWILSKPDGNYFMLFYAVTAVVGVLCLETMCVVNNTFYKKTIEIIFVIFILTNVCITGMTNWAWAREFTEINWNNCGYYNHRLSFKNEMSSLGCAQIYDELASDDDNKVLAFGQHPQIEQFPCIVESDLDVNYWGNQELMSNQQSFLEFVDYAEYDYILVWDKYVDKESVEYSNLLALFDTGKIEKIMIENHHILIKLGENVKFEKSIELKECFEQEIGLQKEMNN